MRMTPHGLDMPGWMIERAAIVRLGVEAARHPKLILALESIQALSQNVAFTVRSWHEKRGVSQFLLTHLICFMDEQSQRLHKIAGV